MQNARPLQNIVGTAPTLSDHTFYVRDKATAQEYEEDEIFDGK
jgi:hypothetical protein